jgi:UDP-glucose 4,6-dehydratase
LCLLLSLLTSLLPPQGDICSSDLVNYVLRTQNVDTIMNFAAQTHVDNSFGNSFTFTETNILGTHVLLEAAKTFGIKLFLHVSTDEVYGEGDEDGKASHEGTMLEPTNPYAGSKAGAEYLVKAYHRSFGLPIIITRGNNVYGPHQYPEKLIPKFINYLLRDMKLTLHGTGRNTRNFLFVEDVARAFDTVLHKGLIGHIYNIGGTNEFSNLEVAKTLLGLLGKVGEGGVDAAVAEHVTFVPDRPFNDVHYHLDSSKLAKLGWREEVTWEEGLLRTVEWYRVNSGNWGDLTSCLVAHPRRGLTAAEMGAQVAALGGQHKAKEEAAAAKAAKAGPSTDLGLFSPTAGAVHLSRRPAH